MGTLICIPYYGPNRIGSTIIDTGMSTTECIHLGDRESSNNYKYISRGLLRGPLIFCQFVCIRTFPVSTRPASGPGVRLNRPTVHVHQQKPKRQAQQTMAVSLPMPRDSLIEQMPKRQILFSISPSLDIPSYTLSPKYPTPDYDPDPRLPPLRQPLYRTHTCIHPSAYLLSLRLNPSSTCALLDISCPAHSSVPHLHPTLRLSRHAPAINRLRRAWRVVRRSQISCPATCCLR